MASQSEADLNQRVALLEHRLDLLEALDLKRKLEQISHCELELGQFSGAVSGVKEALLSQSKQTMRLEEKLSSQLQSLQASLQLHDASFTKVEDKLEDCLKKVQGLANGLTTLPAPAEQLADVMTRLDGLEREKPRLVAPSEVSKSQLQQFQATLDRLEKEILEIHARMEEQAVHVSRCRSRLDSLENV